MLFVLAYQLCSSKLRWTEGEGAEYFYVCVCVWRAWQLEATQPKDVIKGHWGSKWSGRLEVHPHQLLRQWRQTCAFLRECSQTWEAFFSIKLKHQVNSPSCSFPHGFTAHSKSEFSGGVYAAVITVIPHLSMFQATRPLSRVENTLIRLSPRAHAVRIKQATVWHLSSAGPAVPLP